MRSHTCLLEKRKGDGERERERERGIYIYIYIYRERERERERERGEDMNTLHGYPRALFKLFREFVKLPNHSTTQLCISLYVMACSQSVEQEEL
jgi:hypothetical protein